MQLALCMRAGGENFPPPFTIELIDSSAACLPCPSVVFAFLIRQHLWHSYFPTLDSYDRLFSDVMARVESGTAMLHGFFERRLGEAEARAFVAQQLQAMAADEGAQGRQAAAEPNSNANTELSMFNAP
jgi:hypothetical protein